MQVCACALRREGEREGNTDNCGFPVNLEGLATFQRLKELSEPQAFQKPLQTGSNLPPTHHTRGASKKHARSRVGVGEQHARVLFQTKPPTHLQIEAKNKET